jgi:hypothetical protein
MQTLPAHRWDFSATVALLVASFAARIVLLFWLLIGVILPMAAQFVEVRVSFIFLSVCFFLINKMAPFRTYMQIFCA